MEYARQHGLSCRTVLGTVGGSLSSRVIVDSAAGESNGEGDDTVRVNLGYRDRSGRQAAADRADGVHTTTRRTC